MTNLVVLPIDDATDALRAGARHAVRDALATELGAIAEIRDVFEAASHLKPWLTVEETARFVGCDAETAEGRAKAVRKMHDSGLPYRTIGRQRLTSRDELTAWLQRQPRGGVMAGCSTAAMRGLAPSEANSSVGVKGGMSSETLVFDSARWPDTVVAMVNALVPFAATSSADRTA